MTACADQWLITDTKMIRDAHDYTWVSNNARETALLLQHAVKLVDTRRALVAEAGQQEWTGHNLEIVIDAQRRVLNTEQSRSAVEHLMRYGRLTGVRVSKMGGEQ